jgi:hypothetical protein
VAHVQLSVLLVLSQKATESMKSTLTLASNAADVLTDVLQKLLHRHNSYLKS